MTSTFALDSGKAGGKNGRDTDYAQETDTHANEGPDRRQTQGVRSCSGAPLVDRVTFHGVLGTPNPGVNKIKGHVLALDGAADPIVNAQAVDAFEEMTEGGGRWSFAAA
jgi:hypothetical protein